MASTDMTADTASGRQISICFVTHTGELYGANKSMLSTIELLRKRGVRVGVLAPCDGPLCARLSMMEIPYFQLTYCWWMEPEIVSAHWLVRLTLQIQKRIHCIKKARLNRRAVGLASNWLNRNKFSVVWSNSVVISFGADLAEANELDHVWHFKEFGDLDFGLIFDCGKNRALKRMQTSRLSIAMSHAIKRHFTNENFGSSIRVVYDGLGWKENLQLWKKSEPDKLARTFAFVGFVQPAKGQDVALRALSFILPQIPDARIIFIGGGDIDWAKALAREIGVDRNCVFVGYVDDPTDYYNKADAVIVCSKAEGLGLVTIEAMIHGRPVIGSSTGATPELIDHQETGLLFDGTDRSLAHAMSNLASTPGMCRELGVTARVRAIERFSFERYDAEISKILMDLA